MISSIGRTESRDGYVFTRSPGIHFWTMSYQAVGQNAKTVDGHTIMRKPPYIALTRPNTAYKVVTAKQPCHYLEYWVTFEPKPEWSRLLVWPEEQPGAFHVHLNTPREARMLQNAFKDLFGTRMDIHPEKKALAENILERILLLMQNLRPGGKGRITDDRIQHAMEFLSANFRNEIGLNDIAAHVHVSPFHLAHLFKANAGMTLLHYLEIQRIEAAKSLLLSTNDTIYAIAEAVGFKNPYHFSTRFRRHIGLSPRGFREKIRARP